MEKNDKTTTIASRIEQVRVSYGLTKKRFADSIGVHVVSYSRYANGQRMPSSDVLTKICDVYEDISTTWLMTGEGEMRTNGATDEAHGKIFIDIMQRAEQVRIEKNMSRSRFATAIGISPTTYFKYISGQTSPSVPFVAQVCESFPDVDQNWLISGEKSVTEITPDVEEQLRQHHSETEVELLKVVATLRSVIEDQAATINALRTQLEVYKSNIK